MLKRLLFLLFLFSGSLDSFSQDKAVNAPLPEYYTTLEVKGEQTSMVATPDSLRAIILVTLSLNGIAHARMGYVVIAEGKVVEYLDCRKRALKLPQVGWGYRVVNPNEKLK